MIICWGQRGNLKCVAKQTMSLLVHDPILSVNHDSSTGLGSPKLESSIFLMGKCHWLVAKVRSQGLWGCQTNQRNRPTEPSQLPPLSKLPNCLPLELPSVRATWVGHPPGSILKSKSSWLTEETKCERSNKSSRNVCDHSKNSKLRKMTWLTATLERKHFRIPGYKPWPFCQCLFSRRRSKTKGSQGSHLTVHHKIGGCNSGFWQALSEQTQSRYFSLDVRMVSRVAHFMGYHYPSLIHGSCSLFSP